MRSASDAPVPDTIEGLRAQNRAYRSLCASLEEIQSQHTAQGRQYQEAIATLDSEREANARLTDELEALKHDNERLRADLNATVEEAGKLRIALERLTVASEKFIRARSALTGDRSCTCHPDERPGQCQHKYALSDCWAAAEPDESWRRSTALWGIP